MNTLRTIKHVSMLLLNLWVTAALAADAATTARAHSEAFARAMNANDVAAVLAHYAEDGRVIWPGAGDEARGKPAIRRLIESTLKSFPAGSRLALHAQDAIALGGGYIATVSHWEQTYPRADGSLASSMFRASELIRVSGRQSLYVVDHASAGLPAPPEAAATVQAPARAMRKFSFVECDKYHKGISAHSVTPGDAPGHKYSLSVWRHNYTTTDPEYGEADTTVFMVSDDVAGNGTNFGTAVDRLANGESIFWQFRGTHRTDAKDGSSSFEGVGTIVGGTGKYRNSKGSEVYRGKAGGSDCRTEGQAQWTYDN